MKFIWNMYYLKVPHKIWDGIAKLVQWFNGIYGDNKVFRVKKHNYPGIELN